ncbi:BrnA antitoxin family protein [Moraxella sp. ZY210820]
MSIALDPDIIEFFKNQAGERGYQTLINQTLRQAMLSQS